MTCGSGWVLKMFHFDIHHMAEQQVLTGRLISRLPSLWSGPLLSTFSRPIKIIAPMWHNRNTDETTSSHIRRPDGANEY